MIFGYNRHTEDIPLTALTEAVAEGRWEDARTALAALRTRMPGDQRYLPFMTLLAAIADGEQALSTGEPVKARIAFTNAVKIAPETYRLYNLLGNACLEEGDYPAAETAYREAVRLSPGYAAGHCNLAGVFLATNRFQEALAASRLAVTLKPDFAYAFGVLADACLATGDADAAIDALSSQARLEPDDPSPELRLAELLRALGRPDEAVTRYQRALARDPDQPSARLSLAALLGDRGDHHSALPLAQSVLAHYPDDPTANFVAGNLLQAAGRYAEAIRHFEAALAGHPDFAEAHCNLANSLYSCLRFEPAAAHCREALRLRPDFPEATVMLSNILLAQGAPREALAAIDRAIALRPDLPVALTNKGRILHYLGEYAEAVALHRQALAISPDYAVAYVNAGASLIELKRFHDAIEFGRRALVLEPGNVAAHIGLGNALAATGDLEGSIECCRHAIALKPDLAIAHNNLADTLLKLGRFVEAAAAFREAAYLQPDLFVAWSNYLFCLCFDESVSTTGYLDAARTAGAAMQKAARPLPVAPPDLGSQRPLRIGLVSGDFKAHPVGYFLESIVERIDTARIHLTAYSTQHVDVDTITARLRARMPDWLEVSSLNDAELADRIRRDRIDILVDLAGHTAHNRLPVFAWRPAPVQVSWLGFFASTGLPEIDWFLTDPISSPESARGHFTEQLWYLPHTRLCFTPPDTAAPLAVHPAPALTNGFITFGCFQRVGKINDAVIALWRRVLDQVPGSRLLLKGAGLHNEAARDVLRRRFASQGVSGDRLIIEAESARQDYLAAYHRVDMLLDTFPFPGGTTTCEALWMGVPTLTLSGDTLLKRQGASLLTAAGLADWVANSPDDFVRKAVTLATDIPALAALRRQLREQVAASPVMDADRFARHLEAAFTGMWGQYLATSGKPA